MSTLSPLAVAIITGRLAGSRRADAIQYLQAAHPGHHDVEQDEVEFLFRQKGKPAPAVRRDARLEATVLDAAG